MRLDGKVALITGGSQGIGRSIAERFGQAGATLAIAALDNETLKRTAVDFDRMGFRFRCYPANLAVPAEAESAAASAARDLGPIDILINNAGITGPTARVDQVQLDDWDRTLAINLRTPFVLSRALAPSMMSRQSGKIVNMSSIAGRMAYPLRTPYASSKWGLVGLTMTLAQELGPFNIQVNAICPGPTQTDMIQSVIRARAAAMGVSFEKMSAEYVRATALKRMVLPEEVADLALFLSSSASDGITGQAIEISAGYGPRIGE